MYIVDFMQERLYKLTDEEFENVRKALYRRYGLNRFLAVKDAPMETMFEQEPKLKDYIAEKKILLDLAEEWRKRKQLFK